MAIVISGVNDNDKITASDGTIDLLSGVNFVSTLTAPAFSATGNITAGHINIGSGIQLGNAGVATATTFVGNLTGNVNATSNLLLQIGGSEKFRVASSGQLGIGGANYGTSGQVLTSGGSGSAATWSTVSGTTINNNANNRVITGSGTANTLEGESSFTYDGNGMAYITGTGAAGITIQSPDTTDTGVYFSDGANSGAVTYLHSNNSMKFRVNGQNRLQIGYNGNLDVLYDNAPVAIGAGQDLKLYHDGSNSYIDNATNILWIRNQTTGSSIYTRSDELLMQSYTDSPSENYIVATRGADVKLYHNGTHMFQTTSTGVNVQSSGSSHGLTVKHSNGNVVASLHNKGSGDEGYLALKNGGTDTIKLDGEHGRLEGTETKTLNTPRVLISVNLSSDSNHSAYGVQTVYHYGSGVFQVVFAANMPNDNYVTTASAVGSINGDGMVVAGIGGSTEYRTIGSLRMRVSYCTNNSGTDVTNVNLAFFANN